MNENLQYIVDNLDIIRQLYDKEVIISVMDKDKVVRGFSLPDGMPPQSEVGSVFEDPSGILDEVIAKGITKHNYLPKEVMGFPIEGNLVPIKDNGQVVGCVICSYSVEDKEKVKDIAARFQESIQEIDNSIQDVVGGIENLFSMLTNMNKMTTDVEQDVNGAAGVVNKISSNASHSNILALNASIEAARSGEAGRGFAVVATEMGKLAKDSGSSATEIKTTLSVIVSHLEAITDSIKEANDVAKSYMDSISSIKTILEQTISIACELENDIKL
ncbi:MAG: chemotaxis protein [Lachnospira sp.]|nr:chemotaxis protein [Lachnospira sp.]